MGVEKKFCGKPKDMLGDLPQIRRLPKAGKSNGQIAATAQAIKRNGQRALMVRLRPKGRLAALPFLARCQATLSRVRVAVVDDGRSGLVPITEKLSTVGATAAGGTQSPRLIAKSASSTRL